MTFTFNYIINSKRWGKPSKVSSVDTVHVVLKYKIYKSQKNADRTSQSIFFLSIDIGKYYNYFI